MSSNTFTLGTKSVNRLGYGAMQLAGPGVFGPPRDRHVAITVLREALALGVNHIDTSDFYGPHVTNQIIREALYPYSDDLTIVTKIGARRGEDASWLPAFSPAELQKAVHDNLRNLGLDVLDVVNLRVMMGDGHGPAEGSIEASLTVLAEMQQQGLVKHLGLSNVTPTQVAEARKLRAEVEELEHKTRRRDILVDDETLFEFYDQRISHDVISARHFDSWWKKVSRETPDLLNFEKSMLIKEGAEKISKLDYPNFWHQGNLKLRLSYQFEPGADADGVTVHIPLPLLNQVEESGFEWQIPGLRRELIIALIKSLPKPVRRNFVPAPNYAEAFLGRVTPLELPLLDSLERELRRMTGVTVDREDWHWDQVPDHLKITFRVVDDKNKKLKEGRSLQDLKDALKGKVQETLSAVADDGIEQSGLHIWSFGQLPESYEQKRGNYKVKAWPALVDERDSVAIKLFDNPLEQKQAMWNGLRRLLLLNIPSPIKYLHEKLPNKAKLGLYFNPYGKVLELIDDCISCGVDQLIDANGGPVWTEEGFAALHEKVRAELNDTVVDIAKQVEQILTAVFNINKRLKGRVDMTMALGLSDIKAQMGGLVYRGFVTGNGFKRLGDTLRYLQAIEKRLEKLAVDPHRDRAQMLKVENVQQAWQQWINKLPPARREDEDVKEVRWMIEELRVSYFAQQLGTPYPISDKRILQAMEQISG